MGLPIGCYNSADRVFERQHNVKIRTFLEDKLVTFTDADSCVITLTHVTGDCTAAILHGEHCVWEALIKHIPMLLEYLSYNARISCFFSRKVHVDDIEKCLKDLKQFPFMGLHVQKSNRDPEKDTYMITGILKVPNPRIKNYTKWDGTAYPNHNHLDTTKFNELNQKYNLPTL